MRACILYLRLGSVWVCVKAGGGGGGDGVLTKGGICYELVKTDRSVTDCKTVCTISLKGPVILSV